MKLRAILEGWWYTGRNAHQIWAEWAVWARWQILNGSQFFFPFNGKRLSVDNNSWIYYQICLDKKFLLIHLRDCCGTLHMTCPTWTVIASHAFGCIILCQKSLNSLDARPHFLVWRSKTYYLFFGISFILWSPCRSNWMEKGSEMIYSVTFGTILCI